MTELVKSNKKIIGFSFAVMIVLLLAILVINHERFFSPQVESVLPDPLAQHASQLLHQRATEPIDALPDDISEAKLQAWLNAENAQVRMVSYWALANEALRKGDNEQAERYAREALTLLSSEQPTELKAKLYFDLSLALLKQGKVAESSEMFEHVSAAFEHYDGAHNEIFVTYYIKRAFELSHHQSTSSELVQFWEEVHQKALSVDYLRIDDVYYYLGTAYWNDRQFVKGINLKVKAIETSLAREDNDQVQFMMTDVGIDYLFNGNCHQAIEQFQSAIEFNQKSRVANPERLHYILVKLYAAYAEAGDIVKAGETLVAAEEQLNMMDAPERTEHYRTYLYAMQADFQRRVGQTDRALALIEIAKQRHNGEFNARVYHFDVTLDSIFGDIFYLRGDFEQAIEYHTRAEREIVARDLYYLQAGIYQVLYQDYLAQDNLPLALRYLEAENRLQRKMRMDENEQYSQYIYSLFENKKKEGLIADLERSKQNSKWMLTLLAAILLSVLLFAWMLKSKNKKILQLNRQLKVQSHTDGLTSISNRRALDEYLSEWNAPSVAPLHRAIFMIDIDSFKNYNDSYGHAAGDRVLQLVANAIRQQCRSADFVARYGGEEFVVLLNNIKDQEACAIAEAIHHGVKVLEIEHATSEVSHQVSLSIGIVTYLHHNAGETYERIKQADKALYQAKAQGRNRSHHVAEPLLIESKSL
ncbi:GGDEF domain-containing protein [Vibrio panuliri]|uniref:diguanylate cyclase n=1 Tax=Vibrio panuliri TaxID=1381081 RepID=A0ABX3FG05_9VIBR|nr:diguanylate cyclase [Vibrio panuliri]KAB1458141.1 GGDEF domain-containing protein [Vibrio panuliri]OLQ89477.1 hypothetical protein BIY20_01645 [Vibrio panuliri]